MEVTRVLSQANGSPLIYSHSLKNLEFYMNTNYHMPELIGSFNMLARRPTSYY
jgi:hypothetical protein